MSAIAVPRMEDLDPLPAAPDGRVYVWGARPGSAAEAKWKRLRPGDIALIYHDGHFPLWGRVRSTARSSVIAKALWGSENDTTWECMIFFDPTEAVDASRQYVVRQLGYKDNYVPQGFEIPGSEAQARIVKKFGTPEAFARSLGKPTPPPAPRATTFDLPALDAAVKREGLELPPELLANVLGALLSGKHVV